MNPLTQEWRSLLENRRLDSGWQVRRVYPSASPNLFAAISEPEGHISLILEVSPTLVSPEVEYPTAKGFRVFPELVRPGSSGLMRLCLSLSDQRFWEVFEVLANDVAEVVSRSKTHSEAVRTFLARLRIWQRFMNRYHPAGLSVIEQAGLFGELYFLRSYLLPHLPALDALRLWTGPSGGVNDFLFRTRAIEIKTTISATGTAIHIPNLLQLDETSYSTLFLFHLRLSITKAPAQSLPGIVEEIRSFISAEDASSLEEFDGAIVMAGYIDQQSSLYQDVCYSIISQRFFQVGGEFPRLRKTDVPAGVQDCSYTIDLRHAEKYEISEQSFAETFLGMT